MGDKIGVRGPKGAFTYSPNMTKEIGMVAGKKTKGRIIYKNALFITKSKIIGGTGITPMLQVQGYSV